MLSNEQIAPCATRLDRARSGREPISQLSTAYPGLSVRDAYAIQREWVRLEQSGGRSIRGFKVGTSDAFLPESLGAIH